MPMANTLRRQWGRTKCRFWTTRRGCHIDTTQPPRSTVVGQTRRRRPSRNTSGGNRMKPARSLAVSVVALGFAGSVVAPPPAYAAPAPCERAEGYAAQSGAELLRIDRLEVRSGGGERPVTKDETPADPPGDETGAADRVLNSGDLDSTPNGADSDTLSEGIGMLGQAVVGSV